MEPTEPNKSPLKPEDIPVIVGAAKTEIDRVAESAANALKDNLGDISKINPERIKDYSDAVAEEVIERREYKKVVEDYGGPQNVPEVIKIKNEESLAELKRKQAEALNAPTKVTILEDGLTSNRHGEIPTRARKSEIDIPDIIVDSGEIRDLLDQMHDDYDGDIDPETIDELFRGALSEKLADVIRANI